MLVLGIALAACAFVSRAQVALRVVGGPVFGRCFLDLSQPGALRSMRRNENPFIRQWIVAAMWEREEVHLGFIVWLEVDLVKEKVIVKCAI